MNRNTIKFLVWIIIVYIAILIIATGITNGPTPIVSLTAIPLIIVAVLLIRNLTSRTIGSYPKNKSNSVSTTSDLSSSMSRDQLGFLKHQIDATIESSSSYFDDVIRSKLRELLVTKASLQTGIEPTGIRQILNDSYKRIKFLHDEKLVRLLYSGIPRNPDERISILMETVVLIENWNV